MKWFEELKLATKLMVAFTIAALIALSIGVYSVNKLTVLGKSSASAEQSASARDAAIVNLEAESNFLIGTMIAGFLFSLSLGWYVSHMVLRQVGGEPAEAIRIVDAIAGGDLTVIINLGANDNSSMFNGIQRMVSKLSGIIDQVVNSANALTIASEQISSTAQGLSSSTSQMAASIEETSSSMEEMAATI
ncbi:MAG: hypothetical protein ACXVCE_10885, partial [Bacteriovorax sp.]